jgi:hypothetical protein
VLIMAREVFIPYKPQGKTLVVVDQANAIIDQYQADNLRLTLRQLFYQFVARALLPNTFQNYKRLGGIINNARDGGLIDWDALEDRVREVVTHLAWDSPARRNGMARGARSRKQERRSAARRGGKLDHGRKSPAPAHAGKQRKGRWMIGKESSDYAH